MATANEKIRDQLIRHQISLLALCASIRTSIDEILDASEDRLKARIERLTSSIADRAGVDVSRDHYDRRLSALESDIREIRREAIQQAHDEWDTQMRDLVAAEPAFTAASLLGILPFLFDFGMPSKEKLAALVENSPFEGQILKDWVTSLEDADLRRIMNQIRIGLVQGEESNEIIRRVIGTAQFNGQDGVTETTRQQADGITRTAVNFFSNAARREFFIENNDIFSQEMWVSTLDNRTTPICRSRDGNIYPVGEGPYPPAHFGCRSLRVAYLGQDLAGMRPYNSSTEQELLNEFTMSRNIPSVKSREDLLHGYKSKFDKFANKRVRELIGRLPASVTYQEFLKNQTIAFQNQVLGITRAKLFRAGGLTLDRFVLKNGTELTLKQLVQLNKEAFLRAGLNPDDYL